jgi:hypothetical protein
MVEYMPTATSTRLRCVFVAIEMTSTAYVEKKKDCLNRCGTTLRDGVLGNGNTA